MDTDPDEGDSRPVACVTGAARGIGLAYVRALVRRGWRVAALDITGASEAVERLAADTGVGPKQLAPFTCDVSDHASFRAAFDAAMLHFGGTLALFVNNAGILRPLFQDAARVIAVNLTGTVRGTEFAIKHATRGLTARAQGAGLLVVNTSSTNGLVPADCDLAPVYVATKFGIVGLTRSLKILHSRFNVRVNCICPVTVETPMVEGMIPPEVAAFLEAGQRGGVMSPDMCSEALLRLLDDTSIAGEVLTVHPAVSGDGRGGRIEPLDPRGDLAYLGAWREDSAPDVAALVNAGLEDVTRGVLHAWSGE